MVVRPNNLVTEELLFAAFYQKRDWAPAVILAEELVRSQPSVVRLQKALATLSNMQRFEEAIAQATQYIESDGEDPTVLDALKVAHFHTGKTDEAIDLRDQHPVRNPPPVTLIEPSGSPSENNVISFSL